MSKRKAVYEENNEFVKIAQKCIDKFPGKFGHIHLNKICAVNIIKDANTAPKKHVRPAVSKAVPMPQAMHCPYTWYIIIDNAQWEEMEDKNRNAVIFSILHDIPDVTDEEGSINAFDTKDHSGVLSMLGVDYWENPDVADILSEGNYDDGSVVEAEPIMEICEKENQDSNI